MSFLSDLLNPDPRKHIKAGLKLEPTWRTHKKLFPDEDVSETALVMGKTLTPTEMPVPGSSDVISARQNTLRNLKKKKGRASTILTGLFGQGSPTAPVTALGGVDSLASDLFVDPLEDQLAGIFRPRARRNRYPSPRYRER